MTLLPPPVAALAARALGEPIGELAPTYGGFSNLTLFATVGGRRCVIKAASTPTKQADVRREAALLPLLAAAGLPSPPLLAFAEDADWSVALTAALPGRNGLQLLADAPEALPAIFEALGPALATSHRALLRDALPHMALAERVAEAQAALASRGLPQPLYASLADALWQAPGGLVHGDVGLHNLLWDGQRLSLLDWEWASLGPPLLDLAWLRWTIRWRGLPESLWRRFAASYAAAGGAAVLDPPALATLALGQIGLIMVRVADQPAAYAEWLRRLDWTLAWVLGNG
jgi:aminoglycoside phosphotransferase (APT) family kinase protein